MTYFKWYLPVFLFFCFQQKAVAENTSMMVCNRTTDSLALVDLYNATNGASWTNTWNLNDPLDTWYGITTNANACVQIVALAENNLVGTLPSSLGDLDEMTQLLLEKNSLSGSIPAALENCSNLQTLILHTNNLSGSIPPELGNINTLVTLHLATNNLSSSIPTTLGNLDNLTQLFLGINDLTGSIPTELGNCDNLQRFHVQSNDLSGVVPAELGDIGTLTQLRLDDNDLTGTIPFQLGRLSDLSLLYLSANDLTGSIPDSLWQCTELRQLYLQANNLSGTISEDIGNLTNLGLLRLNSNNFSGTLPASLWTLSYLGNLFIFENNFSGSIPSAVGNLDSLTLFYAWNNDFTGNLPSEIGDMEKLTHLWLFNNDFTGSIPNTIGNAENLFTVRLFSNDLNGEIPVEIEQLDKLAELDLRNNMLSGAVPLELGNLKKIETLRFGNNQLGGNIPSQLGNIKQLRILDLSDNLLSGNLPPELANIDSLRFLYLQNNDLTGCYPAEYDFFCGPQIASVNFGGNIGLSSFLAFCDTGSGVCSDNDECGNAIELPMNLDPCGRDSRLVALDGASTSGTGPFGSCSTSFSSKDVWFKVTVPSTGNFLIRKDSFTNIRLYAEAYANCPSSSADTIKCGYLGETPNIFTITNRMPGEVIYFRLWDSLNLALNQAGLGTTEISAHQLSTNKKDWLLCDFTASNDGKNTGSGVKKANEIIIQLPDGLSPSEIQDLRDEFGVTDYESCACSNVPIEVWTVSDPITAETTKRTAKKKGNVDTTGYNYIINIVPLLDTLEEKVVHDDLAGFQLAPQVAMDTAGNYVVVWQYNNDIYARLFDTEGNPRGDEFRVNIATQDDQTQPRVSMNSSGEFIVTWQDNSDASIPANSPGIIRVNRYDANGGFINGILVAENTAPLTSNPFAFPDLALADDGSFIVTYRSTSSLGMNTFNNIQWRKYNATDTQTASGSVYPPLGYSNMFLRGKVAITNNGNFVIAWQEASGDDGDGYGIFKQLYDTNGNPIGTTDVVNVTTTDDQSNPSVAMDNSGDFVITWTSTSITEHHTYARQYNSGGNPINSEFQINESYSTNNTSPVVSKDESGDFLISWTQKDATQEDVYAAYYDRFGVLHGEKFRVNKNASNNQNSSSVALNDRGNAIITWSTFVIDTDIISKRYFSPSSNEPLTDLLNSADTINVNKQGFDDTYNPINTVGDVLVAIMDSGVDTSNLSFQNALWKYDGSPNCVNSNLDEIGYDFINGNGFPDDLDGHGTAVNGRIVSGFPNDLQLEMLNAKFYENGESTLFDAICAIYYGIEQGAKVINLSWGFESAEFPSILQDALDYAQCQDVIVIASAGNEGRNNDNRSKYPSNLSDLENNIISVAAYETNTNNENSLSNYSNFGQSVDIAAPGFVESTGLNGETVTLVGTSLAAPAVSRVAAIIKARYPQLTALQIKDCILSTIDDYDFNIASGGALNESAALACALDKSNMTLPVCESDKIELNANVTEESCAGNDGMIDLLVSGTASSVTFAWSNSASSEDLIDLAADIYTVTATDECGCEKTLSIEVQNECNGGNCQIGRILNDDPIVGSIYRSFDSIESAGKVEAGTNVEFRAGQVIELKTGFHAKEGTDFIAKIEGCTLSANKEAEARTSLILPKQIQLKVFPNPASNQTNIRYSLSKTEIVQIGLYDLNGRLLQKIATQQGEIGWNTLDLSVNHFAAGIYFIRLQSADSQIIEKLVIGE